MNVKLCKVCGEIVEYNYIWGKWFHELEPQDGHIPIIEDCERKELEKKLSDEELQDIAHRS